MWDVYACFINWKHIWSNHLRICIVHDLNDESNSISFCLILRHSIPLSKLNNNQTKSFTSNKFLFQIKTKLCERNTQLNDFKQLKTNHSYWKNTRWCCFIHMQAIAIEYINKRTATKLNNKHRQQSDSLEQQCFVRYMAWGVQSAVDAKISLIKCVLIRWC